MNADIQTPEENSRKQLTALGSPQLKPLSEGRRFKSLFILNKGLTILVFLGFPFEGKLSEIWWNCWKQKIETKSPGLGIRVYLGVCMAKYQKKALHQLWYIINGYVTNKYLQLCSRPSVSFQDNQWCCCGAYGPPFDIHYTNINEQKMKAISGLLVFGEINRCIY